MWRMANGAIKTARRRVPERVACKGPPFSKDKPLVDVSMERSNDGANFGPAAFLLHAALNENMVFQKGLIGPKYKPESSELEPRSLASLAGRLWSVKKT